MTMQLMLQPSKKFMIRLSWLVLIVAIWFLGVDGSLFVEECPDCMYGRDVFQIRVFTIPIYQHADVYNSLLQQIAADLDVPCSHSHLNRWHKHRYWGLLICAYPCINGTERLVGGDEWYDEKARAVVKDLAKANPSLKDEFADKVLKGHDWSYYSAFCERVQALTGERQPHEPTRP
jgi:hypothetical protein